MIASALDTDQVSGDASWVAELWANLWGLVEPLLPWWGWRLILVALVLAVVLVPVLRTAMGRRVVGRYLVGLPVDGKVRTNAEAFRPATRVLEAYQDTRPSAWHFKPFAVRALIRWMLLTVVLTASMGMLVSSLVLVAVALVIVLVWALIHWRSPLGRATVWAWEHRGDVPSPKALVPQRVRSRARIPARPLGPEFQLGPVPGDEGPAEKEAAVGGDPADDDDPASALRPKRDLVREIREPIWDGARKALELSERAHSKDYVILPESVDVDDAVLTVRLPRAWQAHPEQKTLLDHAVMTRLPGEWESSYSLVGTKHVARYSRLARPPAKVTYKKAKAIVAESSDTAPIFGIGPRDKRVASDFESESPHVLLSMGTNAGKSSAVKAVSVPLLERGAQMYIADPKWNSHTWAVGLPNVHIASSVSEMFDMLVWLGEDAEERQQEIAFNGNPGFPRRVVVLEEMNLLGRKMRKHWRQTKPKGAKDGDNPAFEAMADLSAAGRSAYYNLIAVSQMLTTHTMGPEGNTARENFGTRILGRYSRNNWKMLVPEVSPMPSASQIRGRVQVVMAGKATETQIIYYTDEEARAAALSGTVSSCPVPPMSVDAVDAAPAPTSSESRPVPTGQDTYPPAEEPEEPGGTPEWILEIDRANQSDKEQHQGRGPFMLGPGEPETENPGSRPGARPMGPAQAHKEGIFGSASLDTARKALNRAVERGEIIPAEEVKKGNRTERKYDPVELADWWDSRENARS